MYTLRIQADPPLFYSTCRCRERMPVPNCFAATCSHSQFGGLRTMGGGNWWGKHFPHKLGAILSALHEGEPPHCLRSISNTFHWLGWDAIPILNHQTRPQPAPHNGIHRGDSEGHELPIVVYLKVSKQLGMGHDSPQLMPKDFEETQVHTNVRQLWYINTGCPW